jgi:heterodisulfide reductase subunit C
MTHLDDIEAKAIEKLALALHQAEAKHTTFSHYLSYHREVAATLYAEGVRIIDLKWRIDMERQNEVGSTVHNRLPYRFDTKTEGLNWIRDHEQDAVNQGWDMTVVKER